MDKLCVIEQRISPVRGLVPLHNAKGTRLAQVDVRRWMRINRQVFRAEKIDLLNKGTLSPAWPDLLQCGDIIGGHVSLRTDCVAAPVNLSELKRAGLLDVFLCPADENTPLLDVWLAACRDNDVPVRLQLQAPFAQALDGRAMAQRVAQARRAQGFRAAGVNVVNVAMFDPFLDKGPCRDAAHAQAAVEQANALAAALAEENVEVNLFGLPLCLVHENNLPHALNDRQFFLDHQQYLRRPYELARALYHRGPASIRVALLMIQSRHTLHKNPIDAKILPWMINHPWLYARVMAWHKLTRHRRFLRGVPKPVDDPLHVYETATPTPPSGACARCALSPICDQAPAAFTRLYPGLSVKASEGETVASPLHFAARQPKYYDAIDQERIEVSQGHAALARTANDIVTNRPPDRRIGPFEYGTDDGLFAQLEGAVEWHSVTNSEKVSWPLVRLEPPCTVSVTFGGGIAEYVGFSFGRDCKIVCRMEATRHTLVLHVDKDGHYVLLRDGVLVRPAEFEGVHYAPLRLGSRLELRLSVWNIDKHVFSQFVDIWEGDLAAEAPAVNPKYSVVIVNTRYARRLQAVLRCLAHQEAFDLRKMEVIVCYVPGADSTDDLIDSVKATYPDLRILRSPFSEQRITSKGFIINESLRLASGEWIVLLDADTLVPPNMFAKIEEVESECRFIAADGRKMVPPDVTSRILMGEVEPWREWDDLLKGPGELRLRESHGVPVGFFQCFRASCLDKVSYLELDHFEGADMQFGVQMLAHFGREKRLIGMPVLHLDHGGSQWYGTQKHL